ncbi:hypothetical protein D0T60_01795 [Bacteroides sp. 224]|nr:hypothetical protein [Bacteroides sp. 224]
MKLSELYSDCKHVATMKILCASKGITMPEREAQRIENLVRAGNRFFVFISKDGIDILEMRERSELLAKIVSGRVRKGQVLFLHDGAMREITRNNLAESCKFYAPIKPIERDDRVRIVRKKPTSFDDGMPERPHKKVSKKGFLRTEMANESMQRMIRI